MLAWRVGFLGLLKMVRIADDEIGFCGTMSVIATLEFLEHFLRSWVVETSFFCDPTSLNSLTTPYLPKHEHATASAAQRLRPNRVT